MRLRNTVRNAIRNTAHQLSNVGQVSPTDTAQDWQLRYMLATAEVFRTYFCPLELLHIPQCIRQPEEPELQQFPWATFHFRVASSLQSMKC